MDTQLSKHVTFGANKQQQTISPEARARCKSLPCTPNMTYSCTKTEAMCLYSHDEKLRRETLRQMNEAKPGVSGGHAAPQPPSAPPERAGSRAAVSAVYLQRRGDNTQTQEDGVDGAEHDDFDLQQNR